MLLQKGDRFRQPTSTKRFNVLVNGLRRVSKIAAVLAEIAKMSHTTLDMLLAKNNLLIDPKGLSYIVQDGVVSFTDTNISMDADEYLRQFQGQNGHHFGRGRPNEKNKETQDWLVEYLKDGEKPLGNRENPEHDTIYAEAADRGISKTTLWRAADALGVRKRKETFSKRWIWALPEGEPPDETPKIHSEGFSEFAAFG